MNAEEVSEQLRARIGVVELVQKAKSCGKENCAACPHKGYWYAYVPGYFAKSGRTEEVYLGRRWTDRTVRDKVVPLLDAGQAKSVVRILDMDVVRALIAKLKEERGDLAEEKRDLGEEMKRRLKAISDRQAKVETELKKAQADLARLGKN